MRHDTLNGQNEHTVYVKRSYMYELILLMIIAFIVLVIIIRNLTSDTVTDGGYAICWVILIFFMITVVSYFGYLFGIGLPPALQPLQQPLQQQQPSGSEGPVIRIHYV
jgi:glucan phosphoethanolaminetransferase (alkaline phosphatase superfamily)